MNIFGKMITDSIAKANIFSYAYLLCTLWYHVLVSEKNGTLQTHSLYFDKNNLFSVDNTRYNNIFEFFYHIVVYRDIFSLCCDIVIQKISYRGITNSQIVYPI